MITPQPILSNIKAIPTSVYLKFKPHNSYHCATVATALLSFYPPHTYTAKRTSTYICIEETLKGKGLQPRPATPADLAQGTGRQYGLHCPWTSNMHTAVFKGEESLWLRKSTRHEGFLLPHLSCYSVTESGKHTGEEVLAAPYSCVRVCACVRACMRVCDVSPLSLSHCPYGTVNHMTSHHS